MSEAVYWASRREKSEKYARESLLNKAALDDRRGEADAMHAARERHWLEAERAKYGQVKRGKPLSRQPV